MGKVIASATMSLDGFIADPSDAVGPLFDWYGNGDVAFTGNDPDRVFHVSAASAAYLRQAWSTVATEVVGRRVFDLTDGWKGVPPVGRSVFVVTHRAPADWARRFPDAPFTFVTDGLRSAVERAKAAAGEGDVSLTGGTLLGQALAEGLVDELGVELVPVVLGAGIPFFGRYAGRQLMLENPEVVQGDRVTHLRYRVRH
jgi:dihydrofolate reductase